MASESVVDKRCADCLELKPVSEFYRRRDSPDGYRNNCKVCVGIRQRHNYIKNGRVKSNHFKDYGLNLEQYLEIRDKRDNAECEICGRVGKMNIDHDHSKGVFRGFLCHGCNTGIGLFLDDPALLRSAAEYLENKA